MIKINFNEPDTENWKAWRVQCEEEQRKHNIAVEEGQPSKIKKDVYDGKNYNIKFDVYMSLNGQFHGKCAYCETLMTAAQDGEIDHFRPKNAVSNINFEPVKVEVNEQIKDHPGYYWLCYDYKNLLPSCILCNQKRKRNSTGKHTRFPVDGDYAVYPGEEVNEKPLLINPIFEDPEGDFEYDEDGFLHARTDRGQACIDVFGLKKRDALIDGREEAYQTAKNKAGLVMFSVMNNSPDMQKMLYSLCEILEGHSPYSAAGRAAIMRRLPSETFDLFLELCNKLREKR